MVIYDGYIIQIILSVITQVRVTEQREGFFDGFDLNILFLGGLKSKLNPLTKEHKWYVGS
jgi:hypothetical protein